MRAIMLTMISFAALNACAGQRGADERWPDKLDEGMPAPDFTLKSPDGKASFQLSAWKGKKPVVLVFGSYT